MKMSEKLKVSKSEFFTGAVAGILFFCSDAILAVINPGLKTLEYQPSAWDLLVVLPFHGVKALIYASLLRLFLTRFIDKQYVRVLC